MAEGPAGNTASGATAAQLAKVFNCHERRIFELANKGIVVRAKAKGRFEFLPSIRNYIAHLEKVAGGREGDNTLASVRTELEKEKTENFRLKNAALRADLVSREEITEGWQRIVKAVRGAVLGIPTKARQKLPHLSAHDGEALAQICRTALHDVAASESGDKPKRSRKKQPADE